MDHRKIELAREIFGRALDVPIADREALLTRECGDDRVLRTMVERLLEADASLASLLPGGDTETVQLGSGPIPGRFVGPFRLVRQIGAGGMGVVWLAEQEEPIRRKVALKMIHRQLLGRAALARFDAERQALALMEHPNIARVLHADTDEHGSPYFAMEYISGERLTSFCDRKRLSVRERLELVIDVCNGVQHAHQKGVIHRDLKPSNVLVEVHDGRPVPRIIDFGVAKAVGMPLAKSYKETMHGAVVGTPLYMSPEAADPTTAGVDTRSDIYSIGVMTYELLTGCRPIEHDGSQPGGSERLRQRIRDEVPQRPSTRLRRSAADDAAAARMRGADLTTLARTCRGELDWIVMRALEKEPDRRYASAADLAADIRNHLEDRPVSAGPPSTAYRARKFVRRHRVAVAAAAAVVVALAAGATAAGVGLLRAVEAESVAVTEARTAEEVTDFLTRLFTVADPSEVRGESLSVREVLDEGSTRLDALDDQPLVKSRLQIAIGGAYARLGLYETARPLLEEAVALRSAAPETEDVVLSDAYLLLGEALFYLGDLDGAYAAGERALEIRRREFGENDPRTAKVLGWLLAGTLLQGGRVDEAEAFLERAMDVQRATLGESHEDLAGSLFHMSIVKRGQGDLDEAAACNERALEIWEDAYGPTHRLVAEGLYHLARIYRVMGDLDAARRTALRSVATSRDLYGEEHQLTLNANSDLLQVLMAREEYEEVVTRANGIVGVIEASSEPSVTALLPSFVGWRGRAEAKLKRYPAARADLMRSLELYRREEVAPRRVAYYDGLFHALLGENERAITALRQAVDLGYPAERLATDEDLTDLREEPGFRALVAGVQSE